MARLCQERAVPLLLVSQLASHVHPPTCPGKGRSAGWQDPEHPDREALDLEKRLCAALHVDDASTAALAKSILEQDPHSAVARYWQGARALEAGRADEALGHLRAMLEHDRAPKRARPSYRAILREVAASHDGVTFVDAVGHASRYLRGDAILDGRLLTDRMHPNIAGQKVISEAIFSEYFAANRYAAQLLDYGKHDPAALWRLEVSPRLHALALCERYVDETDDLAPAARERCMRELERRHRTAGSAARRRARSWLWELLYYRGIAGDAEALARGRAMVGHPNLAP